MVADEPVSALDVSIRSQVLNLMKRLQAEHGMASIVISHDLAVVKYLSDRIGVMYLGKLVELGSGDDIYRRAAHPYTDALIKTIPLPDPQIERAKSDLAIRRARSSRRQAAAFAHAARAPHRAVPRRSRRFGNSAPATSRPATSRCRRRRTRRPPPDGRESSDLISALTSAPGVTAAVS
jgi:ABC-type oligopeptide transport system ATPase subunit